MSNAQIVFSIALAIVSIVTVGFGLYAFGSTRWTNKWSKRKAKSSQAVNK